MATMCSWRAFLKIHGRLHLLYLVLLFDFIAEACLESFLSFPIVRLVVV